MSFRGVEQSQTSAFVTTEQFVLILLDQFHDGLPKDPQTSVPDFSST